MKSPARSRTGSLRITPRPNFQRRYRRVIRTDQRRCHAAIGHLGTGAVARLRTRQMPVFQPNGSRAYGRGSKCDVYSWPDRLAVSDRRGSGSATPTASHRCRTLSPMLRNLRLRQLSDATDDADAREYAEARRPVIWQRVARHRRRSEPKQRSRRLDQPINGRGANYQSGGGGRNGSPPGGGSAGTVAIGSRVAILSGQVTAQQADRRGAARGGPHQSRSCSRTCPREPRERMGH